MVCNGCKNKNKVGCPGNTFIIQTHPQIFFTRKVSEITQKHQRFSHVLKWEGREQDSILGLQDAD